MIFLAFKYTPIILCSLYTVVCLTNKRQTFTYMRYAIRLLFLILQVSLAIYVRYIRNDSMFACILSMILSSIFIDTVFLKLALSTSISTTIIGYASSYAFYAGGVLFLAAIKCVIGDHSSQLSLLYLFLIGIFQILLSFLIFNTKRLRHGLSFFRDSEKSDLGVYLSIFLLLIIAIFGIQTETYRTTGILFCLILSFGALLWYWSKTYLAREYLYQIRKREHSQLQATLDEVRKENLRLSAENETFSKIIHKDNKLIPAMELAVSQLLYSIAQDDTQQSRMEQAQSILKQLKALSEERAGIVINYEDASQKLPCLGLNGLDALLLFMLQKAHMSEIEFDLKLDDGIDQIITGSISESDSSTLLADLIENALIASNHTEHKKAVQVKLGVDTGIFYISVSDSGPPFPPEVLERWGVERITTHADAGGSGIGMMSIYELCQKYSASFEIEQIQDASPYRKCVSIRFDGHGSFQVH